MAVKYFEPADKALPRLVLSLIDKCPADRQAQLRQSILLTGGCTSIHNFSQRFESELDQLLNGAPFKLYHSGEKAQYDVIKGATLLAQSTTFSMDPNVTQPQVEQKEAREEKK